MNLIRFFGHPENEKMDGRGDAARHLALGWITQRTPNPERTLKAANFRENLSLRRLDKPMDVHNNNLGATIKAETYKEAEKEIDRLISEKKAMFMTPKESAEMRGYAKGGKVLETLKNNEREKFSRGSLVKSVVKNFFTDSKNKEGLNIKESLDEDEITKIIDELSELEIKASTIKKDTPSKTVKAYKLFRTEKNSDELFPLFVHAKKGVPENKWVKAEEGEKSSKSDKHVKSKLGDLAYRPGWHSGDMPTAQHIGGKSTKGLKKPDYRPANQVWAEVEVADDVDWQSEATKRAKIKKDGSIDARSAHITDQVPSGGHYRYKTNPNMVGEWLISGEMRINKKLSNLEHKKIQSDLNVFDLPILPEVIETKNLNLNDLNKAAIEELKEYYPDVYKKMLKGSKE